MTLKNIENKERFQFNTLEELRDWLNSFEKTPLDAVLPAHDKHIFQVTWETEILSDGSKVQNADIATY